MRPTQDLQGTTDVHQLPPRDPSWAGETRGMLMSKEWSIEVEWRGFVVQWSTSA